jgi:hypothetical protein
LTARDLVWQRIANAPAGRSAGKGASVTVKVRMVTLSESAEELLHTQAGRNQMDPNVYGSLVLELAIREREALDELAAQAKACRG